MKLVKKLTNYTTPLSLGVVFSTCMIGCGPYRSGERLLLTQQVEGVPTSTIDVHPGQITPDMINSVEQFITTKRNENLKDCGLFLLTLLQELRKGNTVDVNRVYVDGKLIESVSGNLTALHIATYIGDIKIIEALLLKKADIEAIDTGAGYTPLMLTIYHQRHHGGTIAKLLLRYGANAHATDKNNRSVMRLAVNNQNLQVFEALIEYEVDPEKNITPNNKNKMLALAVELGYRGLISTLMSRGAKPHKEQLARAVENDDTEVCENWLICGTDPNIIITADKKRTLLTEAILKCNVNVVKLALQYGADPNKKDRSGNHPLALAIKTIADGDLRIVEHLLQYGASLAKSKAIRHAVSARWTDLVRLLINTGNIPTCDYEEAFLLAIENGHVKIAKLLLKQLVTLGIMEQMHNKMDKLAGKISRFPESPESIVFVLEYITTTVTQKLLSPLILEAVYSSNVRKVYSLLKLGANPNTVDPHSGLTLSQICLNVGQYPEHKSNQNSILEYLGIANFNLVANSNKQLKKNL